MKEKLDSNRWWDGNIGIRPDGAPYKVVYCMKPSRDKRTLGFMQNDGLYHGKQWGIDGCLVCETRVRLRETEYAETAVAEGSVHPDARMRCEWFRKWATDYPSSLLPIFEANIKNINFWKDTGKKRTEWLARNLSSFIYHGEDKVVCPFCNIPWHSLPGNGISMGNSFKDWPQLVRHINEYHGLVRVLRRGKRGTRPFWDVTYNGDEPYDFELPEIKLELSNLDDLILDSEPMDIKIKKIKIDLDVNTLKELL